MLKTGTHTDHIGHCVYTYNRRCMYVSVCMYVLIRMYVCSCVRTYVYAQRYLDHTLRVFSSNEYWLLLKNAHLFNETQHNTRLYFPDSLGYVLSQYNIFHNEHFCTV